MTAPRNLEEILAELRPALRSGIADLAERLLGPPNKTTKNELRWGAKGSFRVIVAGAKQGACTDFESGWKGDPIALIRREQHCDFIGAVEYGCHFAGIAFDGQGKPEDPAERAAREAERDQRQAEREAEQEADEGKRIAFARRLWDASTPIDGTVAETYLTTTRAIPRPAAGWPDAVRYHGPSGSLILAGTDAEGASKFVQRVRLTIDGRKTAGQAKNTDGVMAGAFIRLPGASDGPLLLAEGPETGLSVCVSTGHETRLSAGPLARHDPPTGRRVVVCRDDDPQQSPADLALKRAMSGWLSLGPDLVVATPWPVRRHDKSDFNDVIQANGADAVRERIATALEPPHEPIHRVTIEEGRAATTAAVADFYRQFREYDARRKQAAAAAKAELTADAPFAAEVTASRRAWADASAALQEARRLAKLYPLSSEAVTKARAAARAARDRALIASEIASEFKAETQKIQAQIRAEAKARGRAAAGPYPVHGIRVDVGTGKSRANLESIVPLIQEFRAAKDKRTIAVAIPAHTLGDQQVDRLASTTNAAGISAGVWRSRRAPDPAHPDYLDASIKKENKTRMCRDIDAVMDAEEALSDVQNSVCRNPKTERQCEFFAECPFQKQKAAEHDVWFVAHELLFTGNPTEIGDIAALVVDESAWQDGLFGVESPNFLLLSTLTSEDATVPDSYFDTQQLRSTRKALSEAISTMEPPGEDDPRLPVLKAAVLSAGIDVAAANCAYTLEWRRKIDAEIYPGMPAKKRKEAVKAVAHNKIVAKLGSIWKAVAHLVDDNGPDRSGWLSLGKSKRKEGTAPAIYIKGRRDVHQSWHVPTLLMDATMQPDIVRLFWPEMELTANIRVQTPHQHITQVIDRSYSKAQLAKASGLRKVHAIICREARRYAPGRVLVVVQKEVEEKLREIGMLPNNVQLAHHNNIAGHDEW